MAGWPNSRAGDGPAHPGAAADDPALRPIPSSQLRPAAETNFQNLRSVRIGTQDRKIASIALTSQLILVTANRRDFAVPGLVLEDWSV